MNKTYYVDMDITMSVQLWIDAENEDEAEKIAMDKVKRNANYQTSRGCFVKAVITDIIEENE